MICFDKIRFMFDLSFIDYFHENVIYMIFEHSPLFVYS